MNANDKTEPAAGKGMYFIPDSPPEDVPHRAYETGRDDVTHVATDHTRADLASRVGRAKLPPRSATAPYEDHIRRALIEQVTAARHKVMFCSFLFADEQIVHALCEAAQRLRGGVYVLTVLDKHLQAQVHEPESDFTAAMLEERGRRHVRHLQLLSKSGAWLRSADGCHAKFCVIDDEVAVVTSANATAEAYESNPEDGLIVRRPDTAHELGRLFAYIWLHLANHESAPAAHLDVHSMRAVDAPPWRALAPCGGIDPVATLRSFEQSLQSAAIEIIDSARSRLTIATYSFLGMEKHPVGAALRRAIERNVEIDLLLQPRNGIAPQRLTCSWLAGIAPERTHLYAHKRTHTKSIIADRQRALIWTGNLEAAHGWDNGIEVGLKVNDAGIAEAIASWSSDVMRRSTYRATETPTARELADHSGAKRRPLRV